MARKTKIGKKFKDGLFQAIIGVLGGAVLAAVVDALAKNGTLPSYSPIILGIFNVVGSLITIKKMRSWGIFYTIGWLIGSIIFKDTGLLGTFDFILNIIMPLAILATRLAMRFKPGLFQHARS